MSTAPTGAQVYGFSPERVTQARRMIRELARVLLTGRPDAEFLRPGLITRLTAALAVAVTWFDQHAHELEEIRPGVAAQF